MKEIFRTTLRLDMEKPAERQAADLLRKQRQEQNQTYSALIASSVNAYYGRTWQQMQSLLMKTSVMKSVPLSGRRWRRLRFLSAPPPVVGTGSSTYHRKQRTRR